MRSPLRPLHVPPAFGKSLASICQRCIPNHTLPDTESRTSCLRQWSEHGWQGPFNGLEYCGCTVLLERKPGVKEMIGRFKRRLIRWFEGALASYDRRIAVPGRSLVPGFHFSPARARRQARRTRSSPFVVHVNQTSNPFHSLYFSEVKLGYLVSLSFDPLTPPPFASAPSLASAPMNTP